MQNETAEKPIAISEIFGPTIQGEGVLLGAPTVFVRTGGCDFRCRWCVAPDTPILLADWTERAARDIAVGDEIIGMTRRDGVPEAIGRYQIGKVEGVARRETRRLRLAFDDGREITVAAQHSFALFKTGRFVKAEHLTTEHRVRALPRWESRRECEEYRAGYLSGAADGDGSFHFKKLKGVWHFVLANADDAILHRFREYAAAAGFALNAGRHLSGGDFAPARHDGSTISIHQFKDVIRPKIETCLRDLKLDFAMTATGFRVRGGRKVARRLLLETQPALTRKTQAHFSTHDGFNEYVRVRDMEEIGCGEVVSIKTSLGTYIANGMLSRNCDTLYAVLPEHKSEWMPLSAQEILSRVLALTDGKPILVTLSGGNPALAPLAPLIELGKARGFTFALETQGSVARDWFAKLDYLILSPKPPSSGMETRWERVAQCVAAARENANAGEHTNTSGASVSLKIVVFDDVDYAFAREAAARFPSLPMILQPGTPPASDASTRETFSEDIAARVEWLIQCVARDGWHEVRIVPQTHVLLWGNRRGV